MILYARAYANMLCKVLSVPEVASLLDAMLCRDDDERLTKYEKLAADFLLDHMSDLCPQAVDLASSGRLVRATAEASVPAESVTEPTVTDLDEDSHA